MKKIYSLIIPSILFSAVAICALSCKKEGFLSQTVTSNLTQSTVFADSAYAEGVLANIYANVGFATEPDRFTYTTPANTTIVCGGLDAACDESEVSHNYSTSALAFAIGSVNAGTVVDGSASINDQNDDAYYTCYKQIRAVNQIFANVSKVPISTYNKSQMVAEARFLRAWYYFVLLEHYGGVPIVADTLYNYNQSISAKRATFEQTVSYISAQCDSAALVLPSIQSATNYGRASGAACMALKARLLLYAASPLFNKPPSSTAVAPSDIASVSQRALVGYTDYQQSRWVDAENAAIALIQRGYFTLWNTTLPVQGYGTESAFQNLFTNRYNTEYIFARMLSSSNNYLQDLFNPPSRTGANGAFPYQSMVDAFQMANGKDITDPTSNYDPNNPYANRDPRFYATIVYDQALLGVRTSNGLIDSYSPINIYLTVASDGSLQGGTDAVYQGTSTGYYNNKMVDPRSVAQAAQAQTATCIPLIRYAEILLDYAEAANEDGGPSLNVYNAVEQIRQRAGLNPYTLPTGLTQDQMRTVIQHERQVELAYEGHRFFDVRRWLIADATENNYEQGMEVDRNGSTVTYKNFNVRKHNFNTKMYLWPFPQAEVGKGQGLVQNPGY